ncbi:putative endonuclease [Vibrio phage 249E41-1]|nr:putative endonuclease [Vibrio phage 249E41-1]CAH9014502.1 putative endonuclease [Vibrio phage 495E54-1]CAH9017439.1 putative endonuclease [Vibrio phage 193E37-1]
MKVMGVDQSLSKCAFVGMDNGEVVSLSLSKTGASKVKGKRKDTTYYDTLQEQIHHICNDLKFEVELFEPERITFEALSFASIGDATRNLACLYGAMRETLIAIDYKGVVTEVPPTSLKSYAHSHLSEEDKWDGLTAAKKPKKVKMDKKLMVKVAKTLYGDKYLSGYNYSTGLDDLADATLLAHKTWSENR